MGVGGLVTASFLSLVQEARKVAGAVGTWPFHEAAEAESHDELIGFLRYTSRGFERRRARAHKAGKRKREAELQAWLVSWRRATRWMLLLEPKQAPEVAKAVLRHLGDLAYYVPCGHPSLTTEDESPKIPGARPRDRAKARAFHECTECHGLGWV